jgi:hypothetical protein
VDVNGPVPPGAVTPHYGTNQDAGADSNDLQQIIISLSSAALPVGHAFDKRNEAGTPNAFPQVMVAGGESGLGRFFVSWDGISVGDMVLTDHAYSFSLVTNLPGPEQAGSGDSISFGLFEDFQVDDFCCGGGRPGQLITGSPLPTTDDDHPDQVTWALVSLIGPDGAEIGASVDPLTGVFSWQTSPTESGGWYVATISGTNNRGLITPFGSDSGTFKFHLIPEPASSTLLALAVAAAIGFLRREISN